MHPILKRQKSYWMAKSKFDLLNLRFGRLLVVKYNQEKSNETHRCYWDCICDCGNTKTIRQDALTMGRARSCGCYQKEIVSKYCIDNYTKYNTYDLDSCEYGIGYTLNGEPFIFDKEDYEIIKNKCWYIGSNGYLYTKYDSNGNYLLHRVIMGKYLTDELNVVDHINHNPLDNRKCNLRVCSQSDNCKNKISKINTSGRIGVQFDKKRRLWTASIGNNYKNINLGRYKDFNDAVNARIEAENKYQGEFSLSSSNNIANRNGIVI